MWYVYYFDSFKYSTKLETFETESMAMEFINKLVKTIDIIRIPE